MNRVATEDRIAWLLREGERETMVPVSERMVVDDDHWRATIERLDVSQGIRVYLTRAMVRRPLTLEPQQLDRDAWLMAHMSARGRVGLRFSDGQGVELGPERAALFRPADHRAAFTPAPGRSLRLVGYMVRADRVRRIFGRAVPAMLRPLIAKRFTTSRIIPVATSAAMRRLAASLFTSPLRGPLRDIFVEGVVLQLLAMKTADALGRARPSGAPSRRDAARLKEARERLVAEMDAPPTVTELARAAGMNEAALNAGFRALFGGSVYEVLRDERLEHARLALETTDIPVKQIAHGVGYSHVTNFISAFARRYGRPPVQFQRRTYDNSGADQ
jgi:AraC-like DNA-binding protein